MAAENEETRRNLSAEEFKVETVLNPEDDSLPYAYIHPGLDGKLKWICGPDAEGKITSVFHMDGDAQKVVSYLADIEKAREVRQELLNEGWVKMKPPEITITQSGSGEPLNRKQKRALRKKIKKAQKLNPFGAPTE